MEDYSIPLVGPLTVGYLQNLSAPWMTNIEKELECDKAGCPDVFESFLEHPTWFCNGTANIFEGGNWLGHVFPGTNSAVDR